jgi:nitrite reductase (NADH) small subunit
MPFVRVASTDEISPGQGTLVERDGVAVAVFNAGNGSFYACSPVCPHEDGPLAEGWLEGESVVCPWHGFDFDLRTGRCRVNDYLAIPVYPVRVRAGEIEVDLP